ALAALGTNHRIFSWNWPLFPRPPSGRIFFESEHDPSSRGATVHGREVTSATGRESGDRASDRLHGRGQPAADAGRRADSVLAERATREATNPEATKITAGYPACHLAAARERCSIRRRHPMRCHAPLDAAATSGRGRLYQQLAYSSSTAPPTPVHGAVAESDAATGINAGRVRGLMSPILCR